MDIVIAFTSILDGSSIDLDSIVATVHLLSNISEKSRVEPWFEPRALRFVVALCYGMPKNAQAAIIVAQDVVIFRHLGAFWKPFYLEINRLLVLLGQINFTVMIIYAELFYGTFFTTGRGTRLRPVHFQDPCKAQTRWSNLTHFQGCPSTFGLWKYPWNARFGLYRP